jgi:hypothetical protein
LVCTDLAQERGEWPAAELGSRAHEAVDLMSADIHFAVAELYLGAQELVGQTVSNDDPRAHINICIE